MINICKYKKNDRRFWVFCQICTLSCGILSSMIFRGLVNAYLSVIWKQVFKQVQNNGYCVMVKKVLTHKYDRVNKGMTNIRQFFRVGARSRVLQLYIDGFVNAIYHIKTFDGYFLLLKFQYEKSHGPLQSMHRVIHQM